jgi:hypothetical protein
MGLIVFRKSAYLAIAIFSCLLLSCKGGGGSEGSSPDKPAKNKQTSTISGTVSFILSLVINESHAADKPLCSSTCSIEAGKKCVILSELIDKSSVRELCRTQLNNGSYKFDINSPSLSALKGKALRLEILNYDGTKRQITGTIDEDTENLSLKINPVTTYASAIMEEDYKENGKQAVESIIDNPGQKLRKDLIIMCQEITEDNVDFWIRERLQALMSLPGKNILISFRKIMSGDGDLTPIQIEINNFCNMGVVVNPPPPSESPLWIFFAQAYAADGRPECTADIELQIWIHIDTKEPSICRDGEWRIWNLSGPKGDKGDPGNQGLKGDIGLTGPQGPQGVTGTQGLQGPQGVAGPTGTQGLQGDAGPQGLPGPQGIPGPIGPQGESGGSNSNTYSGGIITLRSTYNKYNRGSIAEEDSACQRELGSNYVLASKEEFILLASKATYDVQGYRVRIGTYTGVCQDLISGINCYGDGGDQGAFGINNTDFARPIACIHKASLVRSSYTLLSPVNITDTKLNDACIADFGTSFKSASKFDLPLITNGSYTKNNSGTGGVLKNVSFILAGESNQDLTTLGWNANSTYTHDSNKTEQLSFSVYDNLLAYVFPTLCLGGHGNNSLVQGSGAYGKLMFTKALMDTTITDTEKNSLCALEYGESFVAANFLETAYYIKNGAPHGFSYGAAGTDSAHHSIFGHPSGTSQSVFFLTTKLSAGAPRTDSRLACIRKGASVRFTSAPLDSHSTFSSKNTACSQEHGMGYRAANYHEILNGIETCGEQGTDYRFTAGEDNFISSISCWRNKLGYKDMTTIYPQWYDNGSVNVPLACIKN